ncbi:hypothetical protein GCM10011390_48570 [Aureimonas endophytica]|uniref:Uncharacterized protein n=1 Tax=Aureimonas endophytica TaxID=2027858 RepID=A0A917A4Q9_9HYPH|nr:hypothetical protein [Aureimonas endophytica]GGE23429.1 hypothetical protein GCM10011390_48570 [Aureimonas endophytica]
MRKLRRDFTEPADPEMARRQRCNDAAWRFLLDAVAERFPMDAMRDAAIVSLRRPRGLKSLTGSAVYEVVKRFHCPEPTVKLMTGTLADLLVLGGTAGLDGSPSPIAETYQKFTTWKLAKAGAERRRRDITKAAEKTKAQWRQSREWEGSS